MRKVKDIIDLTRVAGAEPVVLRGEGGRVVVVAPGLVGRVLSADFDGLDGPSNAYIVEEQFKEGMSKDGHGQWNQFGGEERVQFTPNGGIHALYFSPGQPQIYQNQFMPPAVNDGRYEIIGRSADERSVSFQLKTRFVNYIGTEMDIEISRRVEVLDDCPFAMGFGGKVECVGFESRTSPKNIGAKPLTKETGALGIWNAGNFLAGERVIAILPYRPGPVAELGDPVGTGYFKLVCPDGVMQDNYWKTNKDHVLVKASGSQQTLIDMWRRRSVGRLGSVNLEDYSLTIVDYDYYPELEYYSTYYLPNDDDPFDGSTQALFILSSQDIHDYGIPLLYELESISPALFLQPGERFCHVARTWHLRGERAALAQICRRHLNAEERELEAFDQQSR